MLIIEGVKEAGCFSVIFKVCTVLFAKEELEPGKCMNTIYV